MSYVIGIDTGGTYTDAVLLDPAKRSAAGVLRKSKAFTTHGNLEEGIEESIRRLKIGGTERKGIESIVLSTTLATNAVVENNLHKVGLVLIGDKPRGKLATDYVEQVPGKMNIKGRVLVNIDKGQALEAARRLLPHVEAIAISEAASIRNPSQELEVKGIVKSVCTLPVMCGHEFVSELGYLERTNTVVINAGLLPIINRFTDAIKNVLAKEKINAPIFIVKGDGSIATVDITNEKPVETVLSGPAASMIGTINLTGLKNAVVSDMGGTTTDTGVVRDRRVELSKSGALIGSWKIKVKSAKLHTTGLGGDSRIRNCSDMIRIGPERVLPVCRGGEKDLTPTDILHYTGEIKIWDPNPAIRAVDAHAKARGLMPDEYVQKAEEAVIDKIYVENIRQYEDLSFPICAIGAPADSWYGKTQKKYQFELVVPENYEVANAVGAAMAGLRESLDAVIRPGEEGHGYLVHTEKARFVCMDRMEAVHKACEETRKNVEERILSQNLVPDLVEEDCVDVYMDGDRLVYKKVSLTACEWEATEKERNCGQFLETRIRISVSGKNFI